MLIINRDKQSKKKNYIYCIYTIDIIIEIKIERKIGSDTVIVWEPFGCTDCVKTHLHIISIKKQSTKTCMVATQWFELLQFTCFQGLFGIAFHFCHMPIPLENPLMTVTRVILQ